MKKMTKDEKLNKLKELLGTMHVPDKRIRRNLFKTSSIRWLNRNLRIRNGEHPDLTEALAIIKSLMRGQ